jgi:hypothetical protein
MRKFSISRRARANGNAGNARRIHIFEVPQSKVLTRGTVHCKELFAFRVVCKQSVQERIVFNRLESALKSRRPDLLELLVVRSSGESRWSRVSCAQGRRAMRRTFAGASNMFKNRNDTAEITHRFHFPSVFQLRPFSKQLKCRQINRFQCFISSFPSFGPGFDSHRPLQIH